LPEQILARLNLADLFLDLGLVSNNAHTTASDALWVGLPLIALRSSAFAGRVAVDLLQAAGVYDMITLAPEEY
jgi:protein O-GlcNAc transferase